VGGAGGGVPGYDGGCLILTSTVAPAITARPSVVELFGTPRVLFDDGQISYSECTTGCLTSTPTWSAPVRLGAGPTGTAAADHRPVLRGNNGTLAAFWRNNTTTSANGAIYAECTGNCTQAASWTQTPVTTAISQKATAGMDVRGALHAVALMGADGGLWFGECNAACTAAAVSWAFTGFAIEPVGAAVVLEPLADGGTLRAVAAGMENSPNLFYAECEGDCMQTGSWTTASLPSGNGEVPDLVFDRRGLPRMFAARFNTDYTTVLAQCTSRPCSGAASSWVVVSLVTDGDYVTGALLPDGRTAFTTNQRNTGESIVIGIENDAGTGYDVRNVSLCTAASSAEWVSGYTGPQNSWRLIYRTQDGSSPLQFFYQAP
jgi:hypothetical protein